MRKGKQLTYSEQLLSIRCFINITSLQEPSEAGSSRHVLHLHNLIKTVSQDILKRFFFFFLTRNKGKIFTDKGFCKIILGKAIKEAQVQLRPDQENERTNLPTDILTPTLATSASLKRPRQSQALWFGRWILTFFCEAHLFPILPSCPLPSSLYSVPSIGKEQ